jgi:hypothetical protein
MSKLLIDQRHPLYSVGYEDWEKWRLTYSGGRGFVYRYLEKFTDREDDTDFQRRRRLTPTPNFAKSAVNEIRNSIFSRLTDVNRTGGPDNYHDALTGNDGGVDLHGSSMAYFMGQEVLTELLVMSKVGIYVDMPEVGDTLMDSANTRPYLYSYKIEDILHWKYHPRNRNEFSSVLLRDYREVIGSNHGLSEDREEVFRHIYLNDTGTVTVDFYQSYVEKSGTGVEQTREGVIESIQLDIERIPFTIASLQDSLLADVANHQIALLNVESSDIDYVLRSNFPFYTEQANERDYTHFAQGEGSADQLEPNREITVGAARGRRYGKGMDRPGYIAPPTDPLQISMTKQQQLKRDIRELVHLAVRDLSVRESAESKEVDNRGLESGLSQIGLVLEHAERKIAEFWGMYEKTSPPIVIYPAKYSIRTDAERREDADAMADLRSRIPSKTFQEELTVRIADTLLGHTTTRDILDKIKEEIRDAKAYSGEPKTIFEAVDAGILDLESAAVLLGYPKDVVKKAAEEHANRLARIQAAQTPKVPPGQTQTENPSARGVGDLDDNPQAADQEKEGKPGRGPSKDSPE